MDKKKTLTLVIETDGSDDCRWIFKSFARARISPHEAKKYGITVRNIEEGDVLAKCREAEQKVIELEETITALKRAYDYEAIASLPSK
jgi:hypothetical protein